MFAALAILVGVVALAVVLSEFLPGESDNEPPVLSAAAVEAREDLMRKGYFVCLENAGDEDLCLTRFGRMMWYPRDGVECAGIGERVDKVLALGGEPKWRDLFKNERCARRGMPHSGKAVTAGEKAGPDTPWERCAMGFSRRTHCHEKYGNHLWYPHKNDACGFPKGVVDSEAEEWRKKSPKRRRPISWWFLFENERCWRLGHEFSQPKLPT
jgi:hypothetical protein